jgi:aspartate aminotransferase/aminotransferase
MIINTPGNPTGVVFPLDQLEQIVQLAKSHGIYVISDEVYEDIVFEGKHVSMGSLDIDDRTFVVSGFSKSYAMTGWRLGYLVCPEQLTDTATKLQEPFVSCACSISQKAGESALTGPQDCVDQFRSTYQRRRDIVLKVFAHTRLLPVVPQGAFYALVDISHRGERSVPFSKQFLFSQNVAVVPGLTFGPSCDNFVRVAFTTEDEKLRTGVQRLRDYILDD